MHFVVQDRHEPRLVLEVLAAYQLVVVSSPRVRQCFDVGSATGSGHMRRIAIGFDVRDRFRRHQMPRPWFGFLLFEEVFCLNGQDAVLFFEDNGIVNKW